MTKTRSTKKALLLSAFSLLICFSMLIGTTFAWFTDSVTSANNIIKSGNLDIELEYAVFNDDGSFKAWKDVKEIPVVSMAAAWGMLAMIFLISGENSLKLPNTTFKGKAI